MANKDIFGGGFAKIKIKPQKNVGFIQKMRKNTYKTVDICV